MYSKSGLQYGQLAGKTTNKGVIYGTKRSPANYLQNPQLHTSSQIKLVLIYRPFGEEMLVDLRKGRITIYPDLYHKLTFLSCDLNLGSLNPDSFNTLPT